MSGRSQEALEAIEAAFAAHGADTYGESVSQLDHALQCAALARREGAAAPLVAAALLHDVGHLFEGRGDIAEHEARDARHEIEGAQLLARWFPPSVTGPIALHVAAKRYLTATEPAYAAGLSPASVLSLALQGGPFTPAEAERFARTPFAADAVRLRRWDDAGKVEGLEVPPLAHWRPLLARVAETLLI